LEVPADARTKRLLNFSVLLDEAFFFVEPRPPDERVGIDRPMVQLYRTLYPVNPDGTPRDVR
jgi:hypothetical protein